MTQASFDDNRVATLLGVSSLDLTTPTPIATNPTTGAMVIDGTSLYTTLDARYVNVSGDESVAGVKTFSSFPITPSSAPTTSYQVANKKYVDDNAGGSSIYTRVLTADLTLLDTQSLVIAEYLDASSYDLDLQGDSCLMIL